MVKIEIKKLIDELKSYRGLKRKTAIRTLANIFSDKCTFDDAGWFKANKDEYIVASTDGITEELVNADPWKAGFYSVLVNVNDIVSKGSKPIGFTGIVSSKNPETRFKITCGIKRAVDLYNLIVLKMHVHPDAANDGVSGTSIGVAHEVIPSSTAQVNDRIIIGIDTNGKFGEDGWVRTFDSIQNLNKEDVLLRINALKEVAEKRLANASRDISVPGVLGSLTMLCESSHVGATIQIEKIPIPENIALEKWLICYPSFGFILTSDKPDSCVEVLKQSGYEANIVGHINDEKEIRVEYMKSQEIFWNLKKESVFGT